MQLTVNLGTDSRSVLTPGTTQSVADGFWIILQPFSAGKHELRFSGSSVDFTSSGVMNFATEAKYNLNVQ
jgi:type 1 fimbria pilin